LAMFPDFMRKNGGRATSQINFKAGVLKGLTETVQHATNI